MTDLSVRALTAGYGKAPVLDRLDLDIPSGRLTAVLGPSGCGKTTLLRCVAGFLRPADGTVTVAGRIVAGPGRHVPPERRAVGIVAQEGALFPHLTVARNVGFGLTSLPRAERAPRVEAMLELVGLAGLGSRMPHELSGGQQQRVALARALAPRPSVVLLDEPFNALDTALRGDLRDDVRAALAATGSTGVLVTHDQEEALSWADHIAVLRQGRVAQHGSPQELYAEPVDPWVASFLGDAVLLPGRHEGGRVLTALGAHPLTPGSDSRLTVGTAVLRPEQLQLCSAEAAPVRGSVTRVRFHGHDALVAVALADGTTVRVRHPGPVSVVPGDETGLRVQGAAALRATAADPPGAAGGPTKKSTDRPPRAGLPTG
ncbi:ABC transporter ATP-binding protein [Streptomyces bohaiensis]|uniref:ABC transporter ATP-binding protein n=1 Tax=Streptomyces bohaiensis TaxID=1431344 RepID=A0ABX1CCQ0_9ACTN|nr:ABC transporter ATP-binding protein [Streptomyces bohaiensis]NJQ14089.1 ABC transporter ATP-binding protein [Streptomyces bohaiensis]